MLNKEEERQILNQGHLTGPHISQRQMHPFPLTKPHQLSLPLFPSASSIISSKEPNQVFVNMHSPRIPKTSSYRDNNQPASVCISGKSLSGLKHRASLGGKCYCGLTCQQFSLIMKQTHGAVKQPLPSLGCTLSIAPLKSNLRSKYRSLCISNATEQNTNVSL